ncbi:MAG: Nif3-like dinuclear metal center hexameric protein [Candidatus Thorarchaeota archaeon]
MTTLLTIVKHLEIIAPPHLAFGGLPSRVEIGPQTEKEQEKTTVNRVLIATYPSGRVVAKATQDKANLLLTHRPLFPFAIDRLSGLDLIRARLLTKNYISSYMLGAAWICARDGIADALAETLELSKKGEFLIMGDNEDLVPAGRICQPKSTMNHSLFANYMIEKLGIEFVKFSGNLDEEVSQTLLFPGSLLDVPEILAAKKQNITTIVTGELSPEVRLLAAEEGMQVYEVGAFVTEEPGMNRLKHQLSLQFPDLKIEYTKSDLVTKTLTKS